MFDAYPHELAGAQRATLLLMCGLRDRGWSVELALPDGGPFADAAREAGLAVTILDVPDALRIYGRQTTGARAVAAAAAIPRAWMRNARWLRGHADLLHVMDHRGMVLMGPAARRAQLPVVWHVHGINTNRVLNVVGSALSRKVLVPSQAAADAMVGLQRREPATIVPYAVDPALLSTDGRPPAVVDHTVTTLARLHPDKGLDVLLRAIVSVRERVPDVRVVIAAGVQRGWEAYNDELLALRSELGLVDVVDFAGRVSDVRGLLERSAVYVQSARERTELQPISVLEALAAGVPVVATRVGAVAEMLHDGRFGRLVPPEAPAALADAIVDALTDRVAALARATDAQRQVREERNPARFVDQVEQVYAAL